MEAGTSGFGMSWFSLTHGLSSRLVLQVYPGFQAGCAQKVKATCGWPGPGMGFSTCLPDGLELAGRVLRFGDSEVDVTLYSEIGLARNVGRGTNNASRALTPSLGNSDLPRDIVSRTHLAS